jgi:hypothetical protein
MVRNKRLELLMRRTEAEIEDATMKRDELRKRREEAAKSPAERALEERIDRMLNPESPKVLQQETAGGTKSTEDEIKGGIDALDLQELKQKVDKLESEGKISEANDLIRLYKQRASMNLNKDPVIELGKKHLNPRTRQLMEFQEFMNRMSQQNIFGANNAGPFATGGVAAQTDDFMLKLKIVLKRDDKGRPVRDETGRFVPLSVDLVWPQAPNTSEPGVIFRHTPASRFKRFLLMSFAGGEKMDYGKLETTGIWDMRSVKGEEGWTSDGRRSLKAFRDLPQNLKDQEMVSVLPQVISMSTVNEIINEPLVRDRKVVRLASGEPVNHWTVVLQSRESRDARRVRAAIMNKMGMDVEVLTLDEKPSGGQSRPSRNG